MAREVSLPCHYIGALVFKNPQHCLNEATELGLPMKGCVLHVGHGNSEPVSRTTLSWKHQMSHNYIEKIEEQIVITNW